MSGWSLTPPLPVLSPGVSTQAVELLASISARTHISDLWWNQKPINTTTTNPKPKSFNTPGLMQFFY